MYKKLDSLPLYYDNANGMTGIGINFNEQKPSVLYVDSNNQVKLIQRDPFMTEIGQIPIESKLVINSLEKIIEKNKKENNTDILESFLKKCKKRAISDRKLI